MYTIGFIGLITILFAALFVSETLNDERTKQSSLHLGFLNWWISGNWPAKIGAGLLMIGFGGLIRYAFLHVDIPNQVKLFSGVLCAALLGLVAFAIRNNRANRALHLALAGSAFGIVYLTAYSAFVLFGYLNDLNGMALLIVVAAVAALFSIISNSASIAILSMVGAFIAPAFAVNPAPPAVLFGYYIAASLLTLLLIFMRGWRALIHLSFLFTLAGSLFVSWMHNYYVPQYYNVMQPILLLLATIHLLMPVIEEARHGAHTALPYRLDALYTLALPVVSIILTFLIAPQGRESAAPGLLGLAALWACVGLALHAWRRSGSVHHFTIALLILLLAGLIIVDNVPWFLILLAAMTGFLALMPRLEVSFGMQNLCLYLILVLAPLHIIESLFRTDQTWWQLLLEKLIGVALIATSARISYVRQLILYKTLGLLAAVWGATVILTELARLHIEHWQLLVHVVLLIGAILFALSGKARQSASIYSVVLACALLISAFLSQDESSWAPLFILLSPLSLLILGWKNTDDERGGEWSALLPFILVPAATVVWATDLQRIWHINSEFFVPVLALFSTLLTIMVAISNTKKISERHESLARMIFLAVLVPSVYLLLLHIEVSPWAIFYDLLSVLILLFIAFLRQGRTGDTAFLILAFLIASLTVQAMLLRVFGTGRVMTIAELQHIQLPALISLLWASIGASLTVIGKKSTSRTLWIAGATLLILSAIKIVLFDFGSFGQIGNILAVIFAGLVFLGVSWFAPFPPKNVSQEINDDSATEQIKHTKRLDATSQKSEIQATQSTIIEDQAHKLSPNSDQNNATGTTIYEESGAIKTSSNKENLLPIVLLILFVMGSYIYTHQRHKQENQALIVTNGNSIYTTPAPIPATPAPAPAAPPPAPAPAAPAPAPTAPPPALAPTAPPPALAPAALVPSPPKIIDQCSQFAAALPSDYVIYAGGAYQGSPLDFRIDQSNHTATRFNVRVHEPSKPVLLVLGAYEPSVWNISWTHDTHIVGVFVSGYYHQIVAGLPRSVPIMVASYENKSPCGYFYISRENAGQVDIKLAKLFGKTAASYYLAFNGVLDINYIAGLPTTQSKESKIENYQNVSTPLVGLSGIQELIKQGKLRPAKREDYPAEIRKSMPQKSEPNPSVTMPPSMRMRLNHPQGYVVLGKMEYPARLTGANSTTFIIPKGVPAPDGNPGHSRVIDLNLK